MNSEGNGYGKGGADADAHVPTVPMSPLELPPRAGGTLPELPERPEGLRIVVGYRDYAEPIMPALGVPRSPLHLITTEWAHTPVHGSVDAWYVHRRRDHWLLWQRYLDDNVYPWTWHWNLVGFCDRGKLDPRTAGMLLLLEFWSDGCADAGYYAEPFEWVDEEGLLSVGDAAAIVAELEKRHGA